MFRSLFIVGILRYSFFSTYVVPAVCASVLPGNEFYLYPLDQRGMSLLSPPSEDQISTSSTLMSTDDRIAFRKPTSVRNEAGETHIPIIGGSSEDEEEDDETSDTSEELRAIQGIPVETETTDARRLWNPENTFKAKMSLQLVLWVLLAGAVYLIMRGATRSAEKQKSLESHKAALKSTIKKLNVEKKRAIELQGERQRIHTEKLSLYSQQLEVSKDIQTILQDIRRYAEASEITEDVEGYQEQGGQRQKQQWPQQQQSDHQTDMVSLAVPGIEDSCTEGIVDLQVLLMNQHNLECQENAIRGFLWGFRKPTLKQQEQQQKLDLTAARKWYTAAAESINVRLDSQPLTRRGSSIEVLSQHSPSSMTLSRARKLRILAVGSVMLRRKEFLLKEEGQLRDSIRMYIEKKRHVEEAVAKEEEDFRWSLQSHKRDAVKRLASLEKHFSVVTDVERAATKVAREAVDSVLALGAPQLGKEESIQNSQSDPKLECILKLQDTLVMAIRMNSEQMAVQQRNLESADGVEDREVKGALFKAFKERMHQIYRDISAALTALQAAHITASTRLRENIVNTAALEERLKTVAAQREAADRWILSAVKIFGPLPETT